MNKTILVTGAAGFIGSHLAEALLNRGDRVIGLDNLNDYYDPVRKRENLSELGAAPERAARFTFVEGDVRNTALLAQLFEETRPDAVAHLAAMAGVRASIQDPQLYFDVNLTGTLNLLELARRYQLGNFVLASTSSTYGETKKIPFVETDSCDRPLAPTQPASEPQSYSVTHTITSIAKM
jgi:UDP-glucuronate 4-epimerase